MASKRRNMFYENKKQETTEIARTHHDIGEAEGDGSGLAIGHVGDLVEGWAATGAGEPALLTEVREKKVTTREETQETVETEDVKHLGDISDEQGLKEIGDEVTPVTGDRSRSPQCGEIRAEMRAELKRPLYAGCIRVRPQRASYNKLRVGRGGFTISGSGTSPKAAMRHSTFWRISAQRVVQMCGSDFVYSPPALVVEEEYREKTRLGISTQYIQN
ncbi:hypothetical protein AAG570_010452 [Ranatra chinensis]|uniref:Uncharacterized protein n=1 Tax=Ranatra chinensis TaxID=642074 RepID=A0ABD0YMP6_9HEMI